MVGEREVLVPEVARLLGHRADRVAAVGPVGVAVQITAQLHPQRFARVRARCGCVLEQLLQVLRRVARERFGDDRRGLVTHARDVLQPADRVEPPQLFDRHPLHLVRGAAEGLRLVPGLPTPHEEVGDAIERVGGIHASNVPFSAWASTPTRCVPRVTNVMLGSRTFGEVRSRACDRRSTATSSSSASVRA